MKDQIAALWADAKAWMQAHVAVTCLSAAVVLLIIIAALR